MTAIPGPAATIHWDPELMKATMKEYVDTATEVVVPIAKQVVPDLSVDASAMAAGAALMGSLPPGVGLAADVSVKFGAQALKPVVRPYIESSVEKTGDVSSKALKSGVDLSVDGADSSVKGADSSVSGVWSYFSKKN